MGAVGAGAGKVEAAVFPPVPAFRAPHIVGVRILRDGVASTAATELVGDALEAAGVHVSVRHVLALE